MNAPRAKPVLSTLNEDGSRNWIRPRLSPGRFLSARRVVGWALIVFFVAAPLIKLNGKPLIFLDVAQRRFHLFGGTFLATDGFLLMLLMLSIFLGIFWLTALFGRVWCGWGCPQTVYMEFLFRPIERLFEGSPTDQRRMDSKGGWQPRRLLKNAVFFAVSFFLANVFLAYFVGAEALVDWVTSPPWVHPGGFGIVAFTTALVFFDFGYFREQMCTVVCPYARLQSGLLDRHSMIVGYDELRGEARKKAAKRKEGDNSGDCIDCRACVVTCPTGIDIRDGLQLECINCGQCIDACNSIMAKVGKPPNLIKLASQQTLQTNSPAKKLRVRTVVYPVVIAGLLATMAFTIQNKSDYDLTVLRAVATPFTIEEAGVRNQLRVKIVNRSDVDRAFMVVIPEVDPTRVIVPLNPMRVPADSDATTPVFVTLPQTEFVGGQKPITVEIRLGDESVVSQEFMLLGPQENSK